MVIFFGFIYGMLAKKFVVYAYDSYRTIFTLAEAERFREMFFAKYPRLLPWHKEQEDLCEMLGGVANRFGRFRKLPDIYSSDRFERLGAVRRAINTPVQGTGSDLLVSSMDQLMDEHEKDGLLVYGTIHDAIVGSFPVGMEDFMVPEIKRIMAHPRVMDVFGVGFKVPLEADVGLGPWGSK
jgi:DNA polymerase-1